jgi:hypothetical protein
MAGHPYDRRNGTAGFLPGRPCRTHDGEVSVVAVGSGGSPAWTVNAAGPLMRSANPNGLGRLGTLFRAARATAPPPRSYGFRPAETGGLYRGELAKMR